MNLKRKDEVVTRANERRGAISDQKGPEYAGQATDYGEDNSDVLANFKRQDIRWGHPQQGLASAFIYFGKHIDSIETFGRELKKLLDTHAPPGQVHGLVERGEGIISRLDDARNYFDLIECLLVDAGFHPEYPVKALVLGANQSSSSPSHRPEFE